MEDLANIRVRHSMLLGVYVQMKNYLDCIERNYLGAMSSAEQELIDEMKKNVILGCAAWKDKVNIEDLLFAGAVINRVKNKFSINCDSSGIAETVWLEAKDDLYGFMKERQASHFLRLSGFGLEKDIRYCLSPDLANILPFYEDGKLIIHGPL